MQQLTIIDLSNEPRMGYYNLPPATCLLVLGGAMLD